MANKSSPKGRKPEFTGTYHIASQPVAGITLYPQTKSSEPTIEEMLEELDRADIRAARKKELLVRIQERINGLTGGGANQEKQTSENPKRYLVDPETGRIDTVEGGGEYTYRDALAVSGSIRGKSGDYDGAIKLIQAAKELAGGNSSQPPQPEKKKEFFVDEEGIIHHDPENGEYTLSEARAVSQSKQRNMMQPAPVNYIDEEGNLQQVEPGTPVVVKKKNPEPGKTYLLRESGEMQEFTAGQPIIIRTEQPRESSTPIQLKDSDGNPMVMDFNTLISWKKFEGDEKRANDEQKRKEEMGSVIRDFLTKISNAAGKFASRQEEG